MSLLRTVAGNNHGEGGGHKFEERGIDLLSVWPPGGPGMGRDGEGRSEAPWKLREFYYLETNCLQSCIGIICKI